MTGLLTSDKLLTKVDANTTKKTEVNINPKQADSKDSNTLVEITDGNNCDTIVEKIMELDCNEMSV
jgi:Tfp pilus assembly protein PilZ